MELSDQYYANQTSKKKIFPKKLIKKTKEEEAIIEEFEDIVLRHLAEERLDKSTKEDFIPEEEILRYI